MRPCAIVAWRLHAARCLLLGRARRESRHGIALPSPPGRTGCPMMASVWPFRGVSARRGLSPAAGRSGPPSQPHPPRRRAAPGRRPLCETGRAVASRVGTPYGAGRRLPGSAPHGPARLARAARLGSRPGERVHCRPTRHGSVSRRPSLIGSRRGSLDSTRTSYSLLRHGCLRRLSPRRAGPCRLRQEEVGSVCAQCQ